MQVKINLHAHTKEDTLDGRFIRYNIYQLIDRAHALHFQALALTGHNHFICRQEYIAYAQQRGILLIPGIELLIKFSRFNHAHVIVLNCTAHIEHLATIEELVQYKNTHPEIFILAPHPNSGFFSMGLKNIAKYTKLFDAVEHTWFYSRLFNVNRRLAQLLKKEHKPFIATSDCHTFRYINQDYAIVSVDQLDADSIFAAIKNNNFVNHSRSKHLPELIIYVAYMILVASFSYLKYLISNFKNDRT